MNAKLLTMPCCRRCGNPRQIKPGEPISKLENTLCDECAAEIIRWYRGEKVPPMGWAVIPGPEKRYGLRGFARDAVLIGLAAWAAIMLFIGMVNAWDAQEWMR